MKKRFAFVMSMALLTGCAAGSAGSGVSVKNEKPIILEEEMIVEEEAAPQETFSYEAITIQYDETYAEEDVILFTYKANKPHLRACREDGTPISVPDGVQYTGGELPGTQAEQQAMEIAETFNAEFEEWISPENIEELVQGAKENFAFLMENGLEWNYGHTLELDCELYQTEQIVSVNALVYSYSGGAHPNLVLLGWNYDLTTGEFFTAESLAEDAEEFSAFVTEAIIAQARDRAKEYGVEPELFFWEDYEEIAANWGSYAVSFDENGMKIGYSPYEMACYAAGAQEFELTYEQIRPVLSEYGMELLGLEEAE